MALEPQVSEVTTLAVRSKYQIETLDGHHLGDTLPAPLSSLNGGKTTTLAKCSGTHFQVVPVFKKLPTLDDLRGQAMIRSRGLLAARCQTRLELQIDAEFRHVRVLYDPSKHASGSGSEYIIHSVSM